MKLETTRIRGVLRFRDEVAIDFRQLPAGLIAFVGENGAGKTTMLEAPFAGTFRQFPSRDKDLLNYVTATDGFIENTFEFEGQGLFRSRLNLDGPHRKAEGILSRILPDGTQAILNDGKVSTFDAEVAKVLPPMELMLASVFAAQNRAGSFSVLDRKGRRELFGRLLGLEHMQTMAERASSAARLVQAEIDKLTVLRDVLVRDSGETVEQDLEQRAQQLQASRGQIEAQRVELQRTIAAVETTLSSLQDVASKYAAARAHADRLDVEIATSTTQRQAALKALTAQADGAASERASLLRATATAVSVLRQQIADTSGLAEDLRGIEAALAAILKDADERIGNNEKILNDAEAIQAAVTAIDQADRAISRLRIRTNELQDKKDVVTRREQIQQNALHDVALAEQHLEAARRDAAGLKAALFGENCAPCPLMTGAVDAKMAAEAKIPGLVERCAARAAIEREIEMIRAERTALDRELSSVGLEQAEHARNRNTFKSAADRAQNLAVAQERITTLQQKKVDAEVDAARQRDEARQREGARLRDLETRVVLREKEGQDQSAALEARLAARHMELTATVERLAETIQLSTLERAAIGGLLADSADASRQATEQGALLAIRRREWDSTTAQLATVQAQVAELSSRRETLRVKRQELDATTACLDLLHTDLIEWTVLNKALGRDGLQAIEIDEAGPAVSKFTNDLLDAAYGPGAYLVDLVTQEAKREKGKDGSTMKDVFEAKVWVKGSSDARDISDLSGGEQVIVEEGLKSGISLLVNQKNQHPIRTCWRDETTGALNADNALHYMAMLRKLHELGGFHQTIFITHNEDAALLADAQVYFADGQVEVRLPPYGAVQEAAAA